MFFKKRPKVNIKELDEIIEYLTHNTTVECNPYPIYAPEVERSLGLLEQDFYYQAHYDKLQRKPIEEMNLDEIATMLTFISRGERFCDGHIASYVESGDLLKLMVRLRGLCGGS